MRKNKTFKGRTLQGKNNRWQCNHMAEFRLRDVGDRELKSAGSEERELTGDELVNALGQVITVANRR